MPIIAVVVFLIQFTFVAHAIKSGRPYWWIFIIMGFPVMGCVIYYFVEVFPGSREHRGARRTARRIVNALQPDAELKRRAEELEKCGSVENKISLARECMSHGMHGEAISLYESCLQGVFATDGAILFGLAQAAIEAGNWDKAGATLARLKTDAPALRTNEVRLLDARLCEGRGETDAALAIYRELLPAFVGLEARYRYGELLSRLGQHQAANHVFNELLAHAKRFPSTIEDEEQWVAAAKKSIGNA